MYFISVILLLTVFPAGSVAIDLVWGGGADKMALIGKWFVFWAIGVRLFMAGMRQVARPQFTVEGIFEITRRPSLSYEKSALVILRWVRWDY